MRATTAKEEQQYRDLCETRVTGAELADYLDMTPTNVSALLKRQILWKGEDGKFPLADNIQRYCKFLMGGME